MFLNDKIELNCITVVICLKEKFFKPFAVKNIYIGFLAMLGPAVVPFTIIYTNT